MCTILQIKNFFYNELINGIILIKILGKVIKLIILFLIKESITYIILLKFRFKYTYTYR